jgi:hypothetical protein
MNSTEKEVKLGACNTRQKEIDNVCQPQKHVEVGKGYASERVSLQGRIHLKEGARYQTGKGIKHKQIGVAFTQDL